MPTTPAMLADVSLAVADLAASVAFYDAALGALGLVRLAELVDEEDGGGPPEAVGWGPPDGDSTVWVFVADVPTTGVHIRFRANSVVEVDTFWSDGTTSGGIGHSAPRRWTPYRRGEYGAVLRDPGGNLIEVVAPE